MRDMKVICSRFNEQVDRIEVVREITNDDGSVEYNCLSLPSNRLEWISAEYGIDDANELAEIAVYESFMPPADTYKDEVTARNQVRTGVTVLKARLGPTTPANNKVTLKSRLQAAGIPREFVDAVDDNAIDVIKRHSNIDAGAVTKKRKLIRSKRLGEAVSDYPSPSESVPGKDRLPAQAARSMVKLPTIQMAKGKRIG